ncbi:MAG TPA: CPBP family glutamic-type intramembrane protease [Acidimicrobiia bacterium]|nr:CPBP family glutamic-type intramembrane protease [Acidimicrobiia bacterium]
MSSASPSTIASYDLAAWPPDARHELDTLARRRGIALTWDGAALSVADADRAQVADLVAYLNGSAAPGVIAGARWSGASRWGGGPAPAWYPNPEDAGTWRWWDGHRWTAFTEPAPAPYRPWFPPGDRAAGDEGEVALRGGGVVALVGFIVAEVLSVGIVLLALALGASKRSVLVLALSGIGLWGGLLGACVLAVRRYGTGSLRDLGLVRLRWSDLGTGVVASIVARVVGAAAAAALILLLPHESYGEGTSLLDQSRPSVLAIIVLVLFVVVGAPFFEELFFRGLVFGALRSRYGARIAVVVQALAFGAVHYQVGMAFGTFAVTFVVVGIAGLVLGVLRWHTHRLGPGMLAHAAFNLVAVVLTFLVL